jgi:hypothetical protein
MLTTSSFSFFFNFEDYSKTHFAKFHRQKKHHRSLVSVLFARKKGLQPTNGKSLTLKAVNGLVEVSYRR